MPTKHQSKSTASDWTVRMGDHFNAPEAVTDAAVRRPTPRYWMLQQTTGGRTYLAGFDGEQTAAIVHIVLAPDGTVESEWPSNAKLRDR